MTTDRAAYANANALRLPLADKSVHMIATSPPYFGLRDYGTATWEGGDPECDHSYFKGGNGAASAKQVTSAGTQKYQHAGRCPKCGANRKDAQLGAEPLHDCHAWARGDEPCGACYVCNMRTWAREMWRVLRDDGCMFLNLGDSYSNGMPTFLETLNNLVKGAHVFFFDTVSIAVTAKSVDVTLDDQRAKHGEFFTLLRPERIGIENGNDDFHEVLDFLAMPRDTVHRGAVPFMPGHVATPQVISKIFDCRSVVVSDLNPNAEPELGVLRATGTGAGKNDDTSLAIEEASEPRAKSAVRWHTGWNTFAVAASGKGIPDVDLMNQPIALRNGLLPVAGLLSDFRIAKASEQQVTFESVRGGLIFTVTDVRHLRFSYGTGSIVPYSQLYAQANVLANMSRAKQEMGIPDSVKKALQADGWICRSTIIWAKPNPMPESVTDRPTKAHEYVFLLTKSARYFWDAEGVREEYAMTSWTAESDKAGTTKRGKDGIRSGEKGNDRANGAADGTHYGATSFLNSYHQSGRNLRTVWTIATAPYSGAHFATWPPALVERMIRAGTSERGVCPECGKPWQRVIEKGEAVNRPDNPNDVLPYTGGSGHGNGNGATTLHKTRRVDTVEWRPACGCRVDGPPLADDDRDLIFTPLGERMADDPSLITGRAGYNRPRGASEGQRPITRYEQRRYAEQLRASPYRAEMATAAGRAFEHYTRSDRSGARPIPPDLLEAWITNGWIERVTLPDINPPTPTPAIVLDPFCGSGTTLLVARQLGRVGLGFDLSEKYLYEDTRVRLGHDLLSAWGNGIQANGDGHHDLPLFARPEATP